MLETISFIASLVLPFWNLPLIVKIYRRKSSADISLYWAYGVWGCLLLMLPAAFVAQEIIWKLFGILNFCLFSLVLLAVLVYRNRK